MEPPLSNPAIEGIHELQALRNLYFQQKEQAVERQPRPEVRRQYLDIAHLLPEVSPVNLRYGKREEEAGRERISWRGYQGTSTGSFLSYGGSPLSFIPQEKYQGTTSLASFSEYQGSASSKYTGMVSSSGYFR